MVLGLLLGTIAVATPTAPMPTAAAAPAPAPPIVIGNGTVAPRLRCRAEFGTASLVQRIRVCHATADWRRLDARRLARRRALRP